jgi:hypothetical protein
MKRWNLSPVIKFISGYIESISQVQRYCSGSLSLTRVQNLPARSDFYAALDLPRKGPGTAALAGKGNGGGKNHATDVTDPDVADNGSQRGPGLDQLQGAAGLSHSSLFLVFGDAGVRFLYDHLTSPVSSPGKE